jgi:transposase InsO family protein
MEQHHVIGRMSLKGNPFDDSCREIFATIKKKWIYFQKNANLEGVKTSAIEYVERYDNRRRMHASMGYLSPKQLLEGCLR